MHNRILQITVLAVVYSSNALFGAEFRILGKLRPTDEFSDARAVSDDGSTIAGVSHTGMWYEAVRWTSAGIESLGLGLPSEVYDVSGDGKFIVGYRAMGQVGEAIRWSANTGAIGLGDLPGGEVASIAVGVSADGSIVAGTSSSTLGSEAFRWREATGMAGLGLLAGADFGSFPKALSSDGSAVVGYALRVPGPGLEREAFRWTAGTGMVGLGDLPGGGFFSEAWDVSADGSVVVGRSTTDAPTYSAFRWTAETGMVELPGVPNVGPFQSAEGISGDGNVIVGLGAMVWDRFHGTRVLEDVAAAQGVNLDGWSLEVARAASYDGSTIVGLAFKEGIGDEAFLLRLDPGTFVPEPSSLSLSAILLATLYFFWRCRQSFWSR